MESNDWGLFFHNFIFGCVLLIQYGCWISDILQFPIPPGPKFFPRPIV
jgi:hypothetical protein